MSFKNKVVIVTGAGSGIGAETVKLFISEGADVTAVDRNEDGLRNTADYCKQNGKTILTITADISNDNEAERIIDNTIKKYGKLDVLVNCAGLISAGLILEGTMLKSFDEVINVNLRAIINLTCLAAPYLVKTKGNIVNISSMGDRCTPLPFAAYCVSKAGVTQFTKGAALELGPSGIRVNAICPGIVRTKLYDNLLDPNFEKYKEDTVLGKIVEPEEIADLIAYLASDKARSVTGSTHVIDNGYLLITAAKLMD